MKKIFSLVVALLTLVSCSEDFLNLTPQYYPNDATFFKTQEQFTQAVNGAYSALRGVSARQGYLMGEMRSDNTHYTRYKADRGLHILFLNRRIHVKDKPCRLHPREGSSR